MTVRERTEKDMRSIGSSSGDQWRDVGCEVVVLSRSFSLTSQLLTWSTT